MTSWRSFGFASQLGQLKLAIGAWQFEKEKIFFSSFLSSSLSHDKFVNTVSLPYMRDTTIFPWRRILEVEKDFWGLIIVAKISCRRWGGRIENLKKKLANNLFFRKSFIIGVSTYANLLTDIQQWLIFLIYNKSGDFNRTSKLWVVWSKNHYVLSLSQK